MRRAFFNRPLFHLMSYDIGRLQIKFPALFDRVLQIFVNLFRQTLLHHCIVKNILSKNFSYIDCFCTHNSPFLPTF